MANGQNSNSITLFSTIAHLFQVNPETRASWISRDPSAIPISIVDGDRGEPRIVGMSHNGQTLLDTKITPRTVFNKRSQRFGQWTDPTNTVYGLGFESDNDILEFMEIFEQLRKQQEQILVQQRQNQPTQASSTADSNPQTQSVSQAERSSSNQQSTNNISETNGRLSNGNNGIVNNAQEYSSTLAHPGDQQLRRKRNGNTSLTNGNINESGGGDSNLGGYPRSQSMMGLQAKPNNVTASSSRWPQEPRNSPRLSQSEWPPTDPLNVEQLKYENERLKQALEESSTNAGIWSEELKTLQTNNFKLTQALHESKANVEQWVLELSSLKKENEELKSRVFAESSNDSEKSSQNKEFQKQKSYIDEMKSELKQKEAQIDDLKKSMQNMELQNQVSKKEQLEGLTESIELSSRRKEELEIISAKLESKIKSLVDIQREFKQMVQSINNSDR